MRRLRESEGDAAPQSYFAMEQARSDANATLIGSAYTPPLTVPQWSLDAAALPKEEPLGWRVDEVPECSGVGQPIDEAREA
ncbi:hypothetical protein BRDID11004_81270 [Bradyrhizobium diazoefficiens]|nr:hypothetical protein XF18B_05820 [Bradyrhizobium diazoefficiens]